MKWMIRSLLIITVALCVVPTFGVEGVEIVPDVVYGHKHGMALTFDVYKPKQANGTGILFIVSGGWYSRWRPPAQSIDWFKPMLDKGFTRSSRTFAAVCVLSACGRMISASLQIVWVLPAPVPAGTCL